MKRLFGYVAALALSVACTAPVISFEWKDTIDFPAWKGEKVSAQAVLLSSDGLQKVRAEVSELKCNGGVIKGATARFVMEVTGDVFQEGYGQCGLRKKGELDSIYVADRICPDEVVTVPGGKQQPVWLSVKVPADAAPGVYEGTLRVRGTGFKKSLPISIQVVDAVLPEPSEWKFHLDLWQNPYSVARYFNVPLWSEEHFSKMAPIMKILADAGQKVITTTIIDRPWNGQTEDPFGSMVVKTLGADGRWTYDYSVFDKWVEFMMSVGITGQINCYSMIPWKLTFDYVDGATSEVKYVNAGPGTDEYAAYWMPFLKDFAAHLKARGWFSKTALAMDERPEEAMAAALKVIRESDPDWKVALAGNFHESIQSEIYDLCITSKREFPEEARAQRRAAGMVSTYYVCCGERYPNTFIACDPMEAVWLGWYAAAMDFDGLLRWAYNSWTADPEKDARFRTWAAGDCYIVYPSGTSVRMERLIEGIQDFEKIRILREKWTAEGNTEALLRLQNALDRFYIPVIGAEGPEPTLNLGKRALCFQ